MADKKIGGLSITFELDKHRGTHKPEVSIWVDENGDAVLKGEERVVLKQSGLAWTGTFKLKNPVPAKGLSVRVHFYASKKAAWSFKVTDINDSNANLARITDAIVERSITKFWYVL